MFVDVSVSWGVNNELQLRYCISNNLSLQWIEFGIIAFFMKGKKIAILQKYCVIVKLFCQFQGTFFALQWRHDRRDSVSNHQPHDCLLNRLFRRRSMKTSKLRVRGLCAGTSPWTGEFPATWPVTRKVLPCDDVIMVSVPHSGRTSGMRMESGSLPLNAHKQQCRPTKQSLREIQF